MRFFVPAIIIAAALGLSACADKPKAENYLTLTEISYDALPGWGKDDLTEALPAFRRSCDKIATFPETRKMGFDDKAGQASDWYGPCHALKNVPANDNGAVRAYFEYWFQPFKAAAGKQSEGLFTGYYQAELKGSLHQDSRYRWPIYARPFGLPQDPLKEGGKPWLSRAEIEKGAILGKAAILLWVDDPIDAHILHIQGSGRVALEDGTALYLGFDGTNGHPFLGLGRILLDHGHLQPGGVSMQAVKTWLRDHPKEAPALMAENKRYVFFRFIPHADPIGAANIPLTTGRSLAVDPAFIGLGTPLWLDLKDPDGEWLRRLVVAQDTGSAIKGPVRGDFYWGYGAKAFAKAGRMKSKGEYYLLLPRWRQISVAQVK